MPDPTVGQASPVGGCVELSPEVDVGRRTTGAVLVGGVPVDDVTMDEAVEMILALAEDGRGRGVTHQVATVNADFVANALTDPALMSILRRTSLSVADGMPVVWGARLLGGHLRERVAGADLVPALVARAAERGLTVVLYGAGPGIAERAADILRKRSPGARVVGDPGPADAGRVHDPDDLGPAINARPDICCVAFGNPKQEHFIERFGSRLQIPVMIGIGGTLDFIVGEKRRAPSWMHRLGLEWLHRALSEPRRLVRRYARDALVFAPAVLGQAWRGRPGAGVETRVSTAPDGVVTIEVASSGVVDNRTASRIASVVRAARRSGTVVRWRVAGAPDGEVTSALRDLVDPR
jgi:N-acetylglucosaminyldiphosphoundecaprenol N-acetyl-beta-D-mannosaminyltransferase